MMQRDTVKVVANLGLRRAVAANAAEIAKKLSASNGIPLCGGQRRGWYAGQKRRDIRRLLTSLRTV